MAGLLNQDSSYWITDLMVINTILMLVLCFLLPPWVDFPQQWAPKQHFLARLGRHELLWIYDMFNSHDEEHAGFLGEFEVRRLMKYMGTLDYQKLGVETIWVFPKIGVPPKHPKMITFSRKTQGCWVPPF